MDWSYMGEVALSAFIFAPGLILLAVLLFVGVLMILEKAGIFELFVKGEGTAAVATASGEAGANPAPEAIVGALKEAIATEAQGETAEEGKVREIGRKA